MTHPLKKNIKRFLLLATFGLSLSHCGGESVFNKVPLTLDPVTLANPLSMAVSPTRDRLYVVNSNNEVLWEDASFVIYDITEPMTPKALFAISIPNFSGKIQLDESRGFAYLPNRKSENESDPTDSLLRIVIDETSPDFLKVESFVSGEDPFGASFDGNDHLFVAAAAEALRYNVNDLSRFSVVDLAVTTSDGQEILADETRELMLGPSGDYIFVTNRSDKLLLLNAAEFTAPIAPGRTLLGTEAVDYIVLGTVSTRGISKDSKYVYLIDGTPPVLKIMSDATLTPVQGSPQEINASSLQVAAISLGSDPGQILIDESQRRAYISNTGDDNISVIDLDLQSEIARIPVDDKLPAAAQAGDGPFGLTLAQDNADTYLYVANFYSNNITVIDTKDLRVLFSFPQVVPREKEK